MTYQEFEDRYKKMHTCGIPFIPRSLAYSSDCPMCEPYAPQWKERCKEQFEKLENIKIK